MNHSTGHDIADALGPLLRRSTRAHLYHRLTEGLGEAVDDLTYPVLSGLARTGPSSAADLGREIGLDRTTVTRRADRLERAGLLQRQPDSTDGRATLLALTDDGHRIVVTTRQRLAAAIDSALATWPPADAQAFARLLRRFVDDGPFTPDHD
ncbi:MarR family winged helix-turn-helix transcriptional regulator [Streptomyces roseoverticillatus]|uniref:MarR family winged helix-turn-helix transcriptional regulator n=1 Tax=Streptomyces roseoverticillatus TaxID=66429 RepID=UPI0004C0F279|nr:MarR family transcriptional regulator [Streptomyces roseoverticillatus]